MAERLQSKVMLAHTWDDSIDPTGWWMSEKYDGVRAEWDGKCLLSRYHNEYAAPDWFTSALPPFGLDGELFLARGKFAETMSIVRRAKPDHRWKQLTYVVFDQPDFAAAPFEQRLQYVLEHMAKVGHVHVLEPIRCEGLDHLKEALHTVEAVGGEGLIIRKPGSLYKRTRVASLLKVVTRKRDEAVVTGYQPGKGNREGVVGALICTWKGVTFEIGTGLKRKDCEHPPKVGAYVTFEYKGVHESGKPREPSFIAERRLGE